MKAVKTIFNFVATYYDFERNFAAFLDRAEDVARFEALGTTEQGNSAKTLHIGYLKRCGAIGFYCPDWVVVQVTDGGEVYWVVETKGRVWEGADDINTVVREWCKRESEATGNPWKYTRIDQSEFSDEYTSFRTLLWKKALKASSERHREMLPVAQEEIRRWKGEGRG